MICCPFCLTVLQEVDEDGDPLDPNRDNWRCQCARLVHVPREGQWLLRAFSSSSLEMDLDHFDSELLMEDGILYVSHSRSEYWEPVPEADRSNVYSDFCGQVLAAEVLQS